MARKESLAARAIRFLLEKSLEHPDLERTLIRHAKAYSARHRVPIPKEWRSRFCDACDRLYTAASKRRVDDDTLLIHCEHCGKMRRYKLKRQ